MARNLLPALTLALTTFLLVTGPGAFTAASKTKLAIGVIIFPGSISIDYLGPLQFFGNLPTDRFAVSVHMIGNSSGQAVSDTNGITSYRTVGFGSISADDRVDLFIIPGGNGLVSVVTNPAFIKFTTAYSKKAKTVMSVCTGAMILAKTGLLDRRKVTANKQTFNKIKATYPAVKWVNQARWVTDGKFWTSSGVFAGTDMARAYISAKFGKTLAAQVSHYLEFVAITDPSNDPFTSNTGSG